MKIILFVIALLLVGCTDRDMDNSHMVIISKTRLDYQPGRCIFVIEIPNAINYTMWDSCSCWDVGDSVDFVKVSK